MTIADHDRDELENVGRLNAFFAGESIDRPQRELSIGSSDDGYRQRRNAEGEAALEELDQLMADDEADGIDELFIVVPSSGCDAQEAAVEDAEPTYERVDDAPTLTPYDKARQRLNEAEILRDAVEPGGDEYHEAMADLAAAKQALKAEQERATDDGWRKRRATDEWRSGAGRAEYNASRRRVRDKSNTRRQDMNSEERAQHDADMNAKRVWMSKKRKAGWSAEKIEAALPGWWVRRLANRA